MTLKFKCVVETKSMRLTWAVFFTLTVILSNKMECFSYKCESVIVVAVHISKLKEEVTWPTDKQLCVIS